VRGAINGLRGVLEDILSGIGSITGTVADILTAIGAIPAAIAELFDPTAAWTTFTATQMPAAQDEMAGVVPGCFVADIGSPTLFGAGGGSAIAVEVGGAQGVTIDVEVPVSSEVAAISYPLSTAFVALLAFLWVFTRIERPIPSEV